MQRNRDDHQYNAQYFKSKIILHCPLRKGWNTFKTKKINSSVISLIFFYSRKILYKVLLVRYLFQLSTKVTSILNKSTFARVIPLGWPRSVYKNYVECSFLESCSEMDKWPGKSRSMTPILDTRPQYPTRAALTLKYPQPPRSVYGTTWSYCETVCVMILFNYSSRVPIPHWLCILLHHFIAICECKLELRSGNG